MVPSQGSKVLVYVHTVHPPLLTHTPIPTALIRSVLLVGFVKYILRTWTERIMRSINRNPGRVGLMRATKSGRNFAQAEDWSKTTLDHNILGSARAARAPYCVEMSKFQPYLLTNRRKISKASGACGGLKQLWWLFLGSNILGVACGLLCRWAGSTLNVP